MAKQSAIFIYFFLISILSSQEYSSFECGSSDLDYIPDQVSDLNLPLNIERTDYNIDLALHVIYGKYDHTDITISVTTNQYYGSASFVVYDIFSKHWVMDDIINFTEPNQTIEVTIPNL
ncbi:uncharacterized protein METZ01_LOCUS171169, partial [marine metagenome]